jgi:molybdenum cofactor cytidylyltransferase
MRIVALILAGGEGRRMGGPKALLRIGEESFLAHVARALARPAVTVVAVLGYAADQVRSEAGLPEDVVVAVNPRPQDGMLSSLLAGLDAAERLGADAVLIHPVDHPLVAPSTVDAVLAGLQTGAPIVVPSYEGRRGHPTGFGRSAFSALRAADPGRGARAVLHDHAGWVTHVAGDPLCRAGINSPEDYKHLIHG